MHCYKKLFQTVFIGFLLVFLFTNCSIKTGDDSLNINHKLSFTELAASWDEGVPLGNGMLGVLVWQKDGNLRFSLDRADLWDLRPMDIKNKDEWKYSWIQEQLKNNTFSEVHNKLDRLYDNNPAPTKIPGAAIEFDIKQFGEVENVCLTVLDAQCEVQWKNNIRLNTFVHASKNAGWFRFEGVDANFKPVIVPPNYATGDINKKANSLNTQDLVTLGYAQGKITGDANSQNYIQEGWGGFKYHVSVEWKYNKNALEGCWSISTEYPEWDKTRDAAEVVEQCLKSDFTTELTVHKEWWKSYWDKANINIPDSLLEKQWYLEMYKFGSAARKDAPPIALQAIWTADNGTIPPWKGDYHHDLNTQLCYWPAYSGNHLDLEEGFLDWLWKYRDNFKEYTHDFYEADGINVPGATSIEGIGMGGWSQYGYTPTASAWLSHHFYLHWRYSMDREFLKNRAYPWIKDVATFLEDITEKDENGKLKLPLSSSPEIYNNEAKAWFYDLTNYDLALIRWTFEKAAEMARELNIPEDAKKWDSLLQDCPEFAIDEQSGLMYAPGFPCNESHRHLSHLLAIHPLNSIDWSQGTEAQMIIANTVQNLKDLGTDWWTGYSFSWFANVQARMFDGKGAAETLRIFAQNFCLPNSFHVNGEQHDRGFSKFKYRPFTIEGNFAFAAAIQEMLIQSHSGVVLIFPAIPAEWKDVSFHNLRTEGAFTVSSEKKEGEVQFLRINSEKGGIIKIKNPFNDLKYSVNSKSVNGTSLIEIKMEAGETIELNSTEETTKIQ